MEASSDAYCRETQTSRRPIGGRGLRQMVQRTSEV